jgi:AAA domain
MSDYMDDLLSTIVPDDEQASQWFRAMLYGEEGSTKTVTACSVGERVLLVESDPDGWVSLLNHPEILWMPDGITKRVRRMKYEGLSQIDALADSLSDPRFDWCDTVVIDTTSQIVNGDLDTLTEVRFNKGKIDDEVPDWPTYRLNQDRVRRSFTKLIANAPKHIILTSHARKKADKMNIERTTPDMPQAVRANLTRLCALVGFLTADVVEHEDGSVSYTRKMQVHPTKLVHAKSRVGGLPVTIINPDLRQIVSDWVNSGAKLVGDPTVGERIGSEDEAVIPFVTSQSVSPSGLEI